ncbi:beta-ketoacyl reductase, partial [Streptomyces palmae]
RHHNGLPGTSIAWGLWADTSGLTGHLGEGDLSRMARSGFRPLPTPMALGLLDAALLQGSPTPLALDLDPRALGAQPAEAVPVLLRALAATAAPARRVAAERRQPLDWAGRLAGISAAERQRALLDLVRTHAATVLGHSDPLAVREDASFKELGFDSLTAVELRNRLSAATGLRLPAALVFDYPEAPALAEFLRGRLFPDEETPPDGDEAPAAVLGDLARLESTLSGRALDEKSRAAVAQRLRSLLSAVGDGGADGDIDGEALESASDDEVFALIDEQ